MEIELYLFNHVNSVILQFYFSSFTLAKKLRNLQKLQKSCSRKSINLECAAPIAQFELKVVALHCITLYQYTTCRKPQPIDSCEA